MAEKPSSKKMAAAATSPKKESTPAPAVQQAFARTTSAAPAVAPAKAKVDPKERQRLVAEAAYYLAQKRGFTPGHDVQDWIAAEKLVDAKLGK